MSPVLGTGTGCPGRQGLGQSRVPQGWPGTLHRGPSSDPSAGGCSWGWKERVSVRTFPMAPQRAHKQRELFPPAPAPGKTARFDALAPFPRPSPATRSPGTRVGSAVPPPSSLAGAWRVRSTPPGCWGGTVGRDSAPRPAGRAPRGLRAQAMEAPGCAAPLPAAAAAVAGDSGAAAGRAPAPCASSPRVPESPAPASRHLVPVCHRPLRRDPPTPARGSSTPRSPPPHPPPRKAPASGDPRGPRRLRPLPQGTCSPLGPVRGGGVGGRTPR